MRRVLAAQASLHLVHVDYCKCRHTEDTKVIDVRCIAAYLVPEEDTP